MNRYLRSVRLLLLLAIGVVLCTAPSYQGTRYSLLSPMMEDYLLRDEFTTALAAGSVHGTNAEPGPGVRTVEDTESKLTINASGQLAFAGGKAAPAYGDPMIYWNSFTRTAGIIGVFDFTATTLGNANIGLPGDRPTGSTGSSFRLDSANLRANWGTSVATVAALVQDAAYKLGIVLRGVGAAYYIKGGIYPYWTLLFSIPISNTTTLYPVYSNYSAVFIASSARIPTTLWLPTPLLSTSGAMTWPTTNGLGHAEGVAGGLGSGGSGLTMLDAGTWSVAGGYVLNTPVAGVELMSPASALSDSYGNEANATTGWDAGANCTIASSAVDPDTGTYCLLITSTGGDGGSGYRYLGGHVIGQWYQQRITAKYRTLTTGTPVFNSISLNVNPLFSITNAWADYLTIGRATGVNVGMAVTCGTTLGDTSGSDNASTKLLPISQLITNVALSTTDVLAEQVINAYTLGTQVGWVQSDRSFAAKAAATAAAGQAILSLKEATGVGGVGLAATDSLTVNGVTYTLTVAGAGTVAYNDTTKTQTVVLSANLGAEVLADAKVGLDWASWNGVIAYFDGAGNINFDEVVAGVYTNLGTTTKAFSAAARFIVRKIGTEYRIFYKEALIGSAVTTVDAASMVGTYWGLFSTDVSNTITSAVIYDTGNATGAYDVLNKCSRDSSSLNLPREYCPDTYWHEEVVNG